MSRLCETFTLGGLTIAAASDGAPERALGGFFAGVDPAEWTKALGLTSPEQTVPFNFGAFLVRGDGHVTLVDTGFGPPAREQQLPGGGELLLRLAELGVRREEIDRVVHTHLHGDHVGWNINPDEGGAITFPNATHYTHERELTYWTSPAADANALAPYARTRIAPLQQVGRLRTFDGEFALSEAITMIPTPGHTPGHCVAMLASQGQHLLLVGDAAHHPVHLERHDWIPSVDLDPAESTRSRGKLAALAADRDALVTGPHFPILTLGRVRRVAGGYRFERV